MRQTLLQLIQSVIKTNGNREITGVNLQDVLVAVVANVGVLGEDAGLTDYIPTRVYKPGETCVVNGLILKAQENTTGEFNPAHWVPVGDMAIVNTLTQRDALTVRWEGMQCYVVLEETTYQLRGGTTNGNWVAIGGADVQVVQIAVDTNGQETFTVPDRPLLAVTINGVVYASTSYALSAGNGTTQTLTWDSELFVLDQTDKIQITYTGSPVTL